MLPLGLVVVRWTDDTSVAARVAVTFYDLVPVKKVVKAGALSL